MLAPWSRKPYKKHQIAIAKETRYMNVIDRKYARRVFSLNIF